MKRLLLCAAALLAVLALFAGDTSAQIFRNHEFHIEPSSLHVNEHIPGRIFYYYSNDEGHIFTSQDGTADIWPTSTFPLGRIASYTFSTAATGWVCGQNGLLLTKDSGMSWQPVTSMCEPDINWQQVFMSNFSAILFAVSP